jgi:hypothetical protein
MRAFPKKNGDRSFDLLSAPAVGGDSATRSGIMLFRGGPNFGSKRLYYDSADYLIRHPGYYDFNFANIQGWPDMFNVGDLTGTGNNVLFTGGGGGLGSTFEAMYVTGKALDDQIDEFSSCVYCSGWFDTIVTTAKGNPTYIHGAPVYELTTQKHAIGMVMLLRGADKIPVRENPKWDSVLVPPVSSVEGSALYPNPATTYVNVTFTCADQEEVVFTLYDVLGRVAFSDARFTIGGRQTVHLDLPILAAGTYELIVAGAHVSLRSKLVVTQQ